jgi:prenyltransferase beta subunit
MFEFGKLKNDVLFWLASLKVSEGHCRYKFNTDSDDTIFCSCFALFILDLFKETEKFTQQERQDWISYIQSFQNKEFGYFEPKKYYHQDKERNRYQLTCFCLSALGILGAQPEFPLTFVEQWETPGDVKKYLYDTDCHKGKPGSGNKAMFLAIFLTYEYERTKERHLLDKIKAWFEFHDEAQNDSGFWGRGKNSHFFLGVQNGFHQLLVYFYWRRRVNKLDRIVDTILDIQDNQGFFSPIPGGWPCYDYDAIHILVNSYKLVDYRHPEIEKSLERAFHAVFGSQNYDGGFSHSKLKPMNILCLIKTCPFYFSGTNPWTWYFRIRRSAALVLRNETTIFTGWTGKSRKYDESNLWDTWFRSLSLAEIANVIQCGEEFGLAETHFHKTIGLGFSRCQQAE